MAQNSRTVLHVGCGPHVPGALHSAFTGQDWREIRLDINPEVEPDIIASMTRMTGVGSGSMDALYSSHNLEHLFAHEAPDALREFRRVLKPDGFVLITLPDIQAVCEAVLHQGLETPVLVTPCGPVAPLDILYGFRPALADGKVHMAHRSAFTLQTLLAALTAAGFGYAVGQRYLPNLSLWAIAWATRPSEAEAHRIQDTMLPLNRVAKGEQLVLA
jgi:SAM-dependent methyltransferase